MKSSSSILGFMQVGDFDALNYIASKVKQDFVEIFEIGTLFGKSAVALDDAFKNTSHHILTLDPCLGWAGPSEKQMIEAFVTSETRIMIERCRCDSDTQYSRILENINGRPIDFEKCLWTKDYVCNVKPDVVFYDGQHTYEETRDVLEYFSECSVICIDDYTDNWLGVMKAVDDFILSTGKNKTTFSESKMVVIE